MSIASSDPERVHTDSLRTIGRQCSPFVRDFKTLCFEWYYRVSASSEFLDIAGPTSLTVSIRIPKLDIRRDLLVFQGQYGLDETRQARSPL